MHLKTVVSIIGGHAQEDVGRVSTGGAIAPARRLCSNGSERCTCDWTGCEACSFLTRVAVLKLL